MICDSDVYFDVQLNQLRPKNKVVSDPEPLHTIPLYCYC